MAENETKQGGCSCCSGSHDVLLGQKNLEGAGAAVEGIKRADFLRVLGAGIVGLSCIAGTKAFAASEKSKKAKIVKGATDQVIIDDEMKELRISATVTKDASQP